MHRVRQRATSIRLLAQTLDHPESGQFARYPAGTFPDAMRVDSFPTGILPAPAPHPGSAKNAVLRCEPTGAGTISQKPGDTNFVKKCPLPIPNWGHYRICFDDNYVETVAGVMKTWPAAEMPIVLDKALISVPSPSNSEDPRRNWVFAAGCRDYYDVQEAYVLVGRIVGDHNFDPGQTWDPAQVAKIHMWITAIK
jgi:hypothetical protein